MSQPARRVRQTAVRLFAQEYMDADLPEEGAGEYDPSFVITKLGAKVNRALVGGSSIESSAAKPITAHSTLVIFAIQPELIALRSLLSSLNFTLTSKRFSIALSPATDS